MANFSGVNFSEATKMPSTEGDEANVWNVPLKVTYIITIIINSIACPFTVLLNVLVIMAVKRRPRLQTKSNILLACLAATDVVTGLIVQPSSILFVLLLYLGVDDSQGVLDFNTSFLYIVTYASTLHLMLVTFERLLAIKFTMRYLNVVTGKNIKIAVTVFWIIAFSSGVFRMLRIQFGVVFFFFGFVINACVLFVVFSYMILYHETRRHQKKIKTQQLPQEEVERFTKENKALKTTVFVVGAVIFCLFPGGAFIVLLVARVITSRSLIVMLTLWARTVGMLNSLLNPLIYCWRQKEMRKFVLRIRNQVLHPANQ